MIDSDKRGLDSLRRLSDEELAHEAARGNEGAAKVLLERFEEPLYRYTVALLRDPDLAREATWSALFESARAVRADEHSEPVAPWLFQIAHAAADVAGGRPDSPGGADDEAAERAAAADEPERERLERLLAGLEELPARDRGSLLLRELVGLEYAGIATVTGARTSAARQAVFRARLGLQTDAAPLTEHCDEIRAAMSKAESGIRERRSIASHLDDCVVCAAFADELERRGEDLRTLFPAPAEPLVAELLPPLPPATVEPTGGRRGRGGRGRRGGGAIVPVATGDRGGRPGRRRGALVPVLLGLLLAGAAIATAIALNDDGGGKHGRAAAAGSGTAAARAGGGPSGGGKHHARKPKAASKKPPASTKKPPASKSKPGGAAKSKKSHGGAPGKSKGAAPAAPGGGSGNGSAPGGTGGGGGSGGGGSGGGGSTAGGGGGSGGGGAAAGGGGSATGGSAGAEARRAGPCKHDPAASPAQSGYSGRAGAAQAEVDPCTRGSTAAAGLADTGLDLTPVIAAGLLLLGLGVGLRRLGTRV